VDPRLVEHFDESVGEEARRRLVGVADPEVDDVLPRLLEGGALALELGEEIGRESLETI